MQKKNLTSMQPNNLKVFVKKLKMCIWDYVNGTQKQKKERREIAFAWLLAFCVNCSVQTSNRIAYKIT